MKNITKENKEMSLLEARIIQWSKIVFALVGMALLLGIYVKI